MHIIQLFPIRAKLQTQKLTTVLDDVAHSSHIKGSIVVVIDILESFPLTKFDRFQGLMFDPESKTASLWSIHMTNGDHRVAVIAE